MRKKELEKADLQSFMRFLQRAHTPWRDHRLMECKKEIKNGVPQYVKPPKKRGI